MYNTLLLQEHLEEIAGRGREAVENDWQIIRDRITFLEGYTKEHLVEEERLMRVSSYPEYAEHKEEHDAIIATFLEINERINQSREISVVVELKNFLLGWVFQHTSNTDMEYKDKLDLSKL